MPYLTGASGSKGGLKSSEIRLWPTVQSAVAALESEQGAIRWSKLYRVAVDGTPPVKVDLSKIGFDDYYMAKKAFDKRVPVRIPKGVMGETFELHQHYGKHEYVRAVGACNRLMYCPSCGAFAFEAVLDYSKPKHVMPLLPSDFSSPVVFYLPELMGYLPAAMRVKLGSYLKAVGFGRTNAEKLKGLEVLMESQDA